MFERFIVVLVTSVVRFGTQRCTLDAMVEDTQPKHEPRRSLGILRFAMVVASFAPLFILWMIRGVALVRDEHLYWGCGALVAVPNAMLWVRWRVAKAQKQVSVRHVGSAADSREHLLVYLLSMLLPFYTADAATPRQLGSTAAAVFMLVLVFWHLDMQYLNVVFALFGYRVFTITPQPSTSASADRRRWVLLSKRVAIADGEQLRAYRLSDGIYWESNDND